MKRFFFSLIALTAAAVGCTQSALLESPVTFNQEVSFSPYTGRTPVTKASEIVGPTGLANAGGFKVFGYLNNDMTAPIMNGRPVTSTNGTNWSYTGTQVYWPDSYSNSTLSFVAYSANADGHFVDANGNSTDANNRPIQASSTGFTFKVPSEIDNQIDLLATAYQKDLTQSDTENGNGQVILNFHHLLSRVGFKVKTSTKKNIIISNLSLIGNMPIQGSLTYTRAQGTDIPSLIPGNRASNVSYEYVSGGTTPVYAFEVDSETQKEVSTPKRIPRTGSEYLMIMPHAAYDGTDGLGSDHIINVTYKIQQSANGVTPIVYSTEKTAHIRLPIGFEFEANKAYEFILNVSTSAISFDITEEDWSSGGSVTTDPLGPGTVPDPEPKPEPEPEPQPEPSSPSSKTAQGEYCAMTLNLNDISTNSASVTLQLLDDFSDWWGDSAAYTKYVGIAYRKVGNDSWTQLSAGNYVAHPYNFALNNLEPGIEYEICPYTYRYVKYIINETVIFDGSSNNPDGKLTFHTQSNCSTFSIEVNSSVTTNEATIRSTCIPAKVNGQQVSVSEYGFYWAMGNGGYESLKNHVTNSSTPQVSGDISSFSYIVDDLRPNQQYSYYSYVVVADDVYAYVVPKGEILPLETLIYSKGEVIYSPLLTFMTSPIVNGGDNTGGNFEGEDDTIIDFN